MLGQQVMKHLRVLPCHCGSQNGQHANREPQIDRQAIDVPGASAGPRTDNHLVLFQVRDDLIDQGINGAASPVHNALAADLYNVHPGQDDVSGNRFCGLHHCRIGERSFHKVVAQGQHGVFVHE